MIQITKVKEIKKFLRDKQKEGKTIGFVPTMGYLHEGHLSLMKESVKENDITVVSIFVNPTQFGANEDLDSYPRDLERDLKLAKEMNVSVVFTPEAGELYPSYYQTYVNVNELTKSLCGASRPGHFQGVTTIVTKLFNIVYPNRAYFGQKDAQQVIVIKRMVEDLNMDVQVVTCPIVREDDGLAKSSRNTYLSQEERKQAVIISKSLREAKELIIKGERDTGTIKNYIINSINKMPLASIDYVSVVDTNSLEEVTRIEDEVLIALAVKIGKTRLIDNIQLEVN